MLAAAAALMGSTREARAEFAAPAAVAPPAPAPAADPPWFAPAYEHAVGSVVRVEAASGFGAGFVFASPRHIATAFHVISIGREITP